MLKKSLVMILISLVLMSTLSMTTFAAGTDASAVEDLSTMGFCAGPYLPPEYFDNAPTMPKTTRYEDSMISNRVATITVTIQSPLEKSWRDTYSDYYYQANEVVERIDDFLYEQFGIDFYTISQPSWDIGSIAQPGVAINTLISTHGTGNADIMLAFAGPIYDSAMGGSGYGITPNTGQPYCVVFDHGYNQNCKSAQHEIGHAYGMTHCTKTCVMQQGADTNWNWFDHLCPEHYLLWDAVKDNY